MWFDIWFLARGPTLGDICLITTTSCTRVNSVFSKSVMLFSQIVCLWESLYIPLFLKVMQLFVWKNLQGLLKSIIVVVRVHYVVFTPFTLPRVKWNFFEVSPSLLEAILRYIGAHFGVYPSVFKRCFPSYLMKLCKDVFCITLTINVLRKISLHRSLC